jgi:hypothetical protein
MKLAWLWRLMFRFMSPERKAEAARRYRAGTVLLQRA